MFLSPLNDIIFNHNFSDFNTYIKLHPDLIDPALCMASEHGSLDMVKILLEQKADVNFGEGRPLYNACAVNRVDKIKLLIEHKAIVGSFGLLHLACKNKNIELVNILLDQNPILKLSGAIKLARETGQFDMLELLEMHEKHQVAKRRIVKRCQEPVVQQPQVS